MLCMRINHKKLRLEGYILLVLQRLSLCDCFWIVATCLTGDSPKLRQAVEGLNEIREKWLPKLQDKVVDFVLSFHVRPVKKDDQIDLRCFNSEPTDDPEHTLISPSVQCEPGIMALLKYWFKDCYDNHPYCRPPSPPFIPSRLLLIENEHSAKVLETKDCNAHYRYVALSHCWGDANRLKLQKSNMVDLLKHISITELPTTYREGISITLALGFSYIWIDSLCIIQDDEQDWAKEAAMMKDVFEHCSINLSATAAPDSSQSNFTHRDPTSIPPLEIDTLNQKWEGPGQSKHWLAR
ncbi:heterokaryon incompatibility protein domain-containing protein, partial [Neurospora intermedia]